MQKIDFVKNLEIIVSKLESASIVDLFQNGIAGGRPDYNYGLINPLLFQSKSNFEQIKNYDQIREILQSLGGDFLYDEKNLASLTTILRPTSASTIIGHQTSSAFYLFHRALLLTLKLSKEVLLSNILEDGFQQTLDKGVLIFQIIIETEGLETEKYIKILSILNELIEIISKIEGEIDQKSEIVLLDSGSDTNLGVKAGIETTKSLFLVFKEIWDYIINFRHYKQAVTNKTLLDSLSIREEIKKKVEAGIITEEEGKEYAHIIKTRTDDLIGMKVMPKQIVIESTEIQNKKLLTEFEGYKMLGQGD